MTSIRFDIGSNVDFIDEEIIDTRLIPFQDHSIMESQKYKPWIENFGSEWCVLEIDFTIQTAGTLTRIDQLFDCEDEMVCYYAYADFTTTKSLSVILDPIEIVETYQLGGQTRLHTVPLTFLQSS